MSARLHRLIQSASSEDLLRSFSSLHRMACATMGSAIAESRSKNLLSSRSVARSVMLGLGARGKRFENLQGTPKYAPNMLASEMVSQIDRLALTTGKPPVLDYKQRMGSRHIADKFAPD